MKTRFPFRYGIASMSEVPHLFLRAEMKIDGKDSVGISSEGLPPKWFTKNLDDTMEEELDGLLGTITRAVRSGENLGEHDSLFAFWMDLYRQQHEWASAKEIPPLLSQFGVTLVERAMIDGLCRHTGTNFAQALSENRFGIKLNEIHPELSDYQPSDFLPAPGSQVSTRISRHTIGLTDPLTNAEITDEDRADDGLPQALEDCIREYGLKYFKVKIFDDLETDLERMAGMAELFSKYVPDYRFTLDGNEQFKTIDAFRDYWDRCLSDQRLKDFLSPDHLLFIEQPLHRDEALADHVAADLASWKNARPLIIDESDAELNSTARALELGYAGTSHKNCKGVFKSIANACLLEQRRRQNRGDSPMILSGEDLVNVGPVALLQDLTVMHALGIQHVERNGHHFFRGLAAFPDSVQKAVLRDHGDLYTAHAEGFPRLKIQDGKLNMKSLIDAPFGTAFRIDQVTPDWKWLSVSEIDFSYLLR